MLSEIKIISENLEKLKEKLNLSKIQSQPTSQTSIFSAMEIRKGSASSKLDKSENKITSNEQLSKVLNKSKKNNFRVTYLKDTFQFMDLKSILNLTLVNKEFNYFLKSIYFYKFMKQIKNYKNSLNQRKEFLTKEKEKEKPSSKGLLGNFVGAFRFGSSTSLKSKNVQIDPKLLTEKINTWENILKIKLKNIEITDRIKEQREEIDSLIAERTPKKETSSHTALGGIFKDKEIEQIKREKIEKEFMNLNEEVKSLRKENDQIKEIIETFQREEIEKEKIISSLKIYVNNNIKIEDLKITTDDKLSSGKYGEVDNDIHTMTLYNHYIN